MLIVKDNYSKSSIAIFTASFLILMKMVLNYFYSNHIFSYSYDVKMQLFFLGFITLIAILIREKYFWAKILLLVSILFSSLLLFFNLVTLTANQSLHEVILISGTTLLLVYSFIIVLKKPIFLDR